MPELVGRVVVLRRLARSGEVELICGRCALVEPARFSSPRAR